MQQLENKENIKKQTQEEMEKGIHFNSSSDLLDVTGRGEIDDENLDDGIFVS